MCGSGIDPITAGLAGMLLGIFVVGFVLIVVIGRRGGGQLGDPQ